MSEIELPYQTLARRAIRTVTDKKKLRGHFPPDRFEDPNDIGDAFHRPEIGDVNKNLLPLRSDSLPDLFGVDPTIFLGVDKIRNHLNVLVDMVVREGLFLQKPRDGGYSVALFDAKLHDGQITWFQADQGDIRSM